MANDMFGEGMSPRSLSEFIVLTWKKRKMFILNRETLDLVDEYRLPDAIAEGWGVTTHKYSDRRTWTLYVSDGTSSLHHVDAGELQVLKSVTVKDSSGKTWNKLNELEFVDGYVYANVWYSSYILKIDPDSGIVVKKWNIRSL